MLVLLIFALWFILRGDLLYVLPYVILFMCFSVLLILRLPRLGEERANLSAFRKVVRFVLVWICRFSLPLGVWEGLRFVIVALPGLFSYLVLVGSIRVTCRSKIAKNPSDQKSEMALMAAIFKIYFSLLLLLPPS